MDASEPDLFAAATYRRDRSLLARVRRRLTQLRAVRPLTLRLDQPIVSFTFDDFPETAATSGADILEAAGARGTFYTATGLMGRDTLMGRIAGPGTIRRLAEAGHEIALHTRSHCNCAGLSPDRVVHELEQNTEDLATILGRAPSSHFAYPFGETTMQLKKCLTPRAATARGIYAGLNRTGADAMQLFALELKSDPATLDRALAAFDNAATAPAWAIVFTHDVREDPSEFGTTPSMLAEAVAAARHIGARILTIEEAFRIAAI